MHQFPWHLASGFPRHRGVSPLRLAWLFWPALALAAVAPGARAEQSVEVIPLNYIDAREAAEVINALYASEVRAVAFPPTNSLLLDMTPSGATAPNASPGLMPINPRQLPAGPAFGNPYGSPYGSPYGNPNGNPYPYGSPYGRATFGQPMGQPALQPVGPMNPNAGPAWQPAPQMPQAPPVPQRPAPPVTAPPMNNPEAPPTP